MHIHLLPVHKPHEATDNLINGLNKNPSCLEIRFKREIPLKNIHRLFDKRTPLNKYRTGKSSVYNFYASGWRIMGAKFGSF